MLWIESNISVEKATFVHINLAYEELRPVFERLADLVSLADDSAKLTGYVKGQMEEAAKVYIDFILALDIFILIINHFCTIILQ